MSKVQAFATPQNQDPVQKTLPEEKHNAPDQKAVVPYNVWGPEEVSLLKSRFVTLPLTPDSLGKKLAASFLSASPKQQQSIIKKVIKTNESFQNFLENLTQEAQQSLVDFFLSYPPMVRELISSQVSLEVLFNNYLIYNNWDTTIKNQLAVALANGLTPEALHELLNNPKQWQAFLQLADVESQKEGDQSQAFQKIGEAFLSSPALSWMTVINNASTFKNFTEIIRFPKNQQEALKQSFSAHLSEITKKKKAPIDYLLASVVHLEAAFKWVQTWPKKEQHIFIQAFQNAIKTNSEQQERLSTYFGLNKKTMDSFLEEESFHKYSLDKVLIVLQSIETFKTTSAGRVQLASFSSSS